MTTLTDLDLMPFLNTFADNPDNWMPFLALADYFADHGDEVGEAWALWVEDKRRVPNGRVHILKDTLTWIWHDDPTAQEHDNLPMALEYRCREMSHRKSLHGTESMQLAYLFLLAAWRQSTPAQRASYNKWEPK